MKTKIFFLLSIFTVISSLSQADEQSKDCSKYYPEIHGTIRSCSRSNRLDACITYYYAKPRHADPFCNEELRQDCNSMCVSEHGFGSDECEQVICHIKGQQ